MPEPTPVGPAGGVGALLVLVLVLGLVEEPAAGEAAGVTGVSLTAGGEEVVSTGDWVVGAGVGAETVTVVT